MRFPLIALLGPIVLHRAAFLSKRQSSWAWLLQPQAPARRHVDAACAAQEINSVCIAPLRLLLMGVCTENLSSGVVVVKSAKDGV